MPYGEVPYNSGDMNRSAAAQHLCGEDAITPRESARLWGVDWAACTPWAFDDVRVVMGTFDDATPFVEAHYPSIFTAHGTKFLADPMTAAKRRFAAGMDVFLCHADGAMVGVLMGHPLDWSTYYMRSAALLPRYRDRRVLTRLVEDHVRAAPRRRRRTHGGRRRADELSR